MTGRRDIFLWAGTVGAVIALVAGLAMLVRPRVFGAQTSPRVRRVLGACLILIAAMHLADHARSILLPGRG